MSTRTFRIILIAFVVLFVFLLAGRNHLRAYWWATRLTSTTDLKAQGYYLACLAGVGDAAKRPIASLARHSRPEVRLLSIYALQKLPLETAVPELARLLVDTDVSIRDAAATALVFTESNYAIDVLVASATSDNPILASTAVAALGRTSTSEAMRAVRSVARVHDSPMVRAQALEALIDSLLTDPLDAPTSRQDERALSIETLIAALADEATFSELLSLERQRAAAERFVATRATSQRSDKEAGFRRSVAEVAALYLSDLSGQTVRPVPILDPSERDKLIQRCSVELAKRRTADASNAEMYKSLTTAPASGPAE
ncbi:MAG: HEAT repeat domain-containing protein [Planctomycetes bacterium]|nr:HEAT repeat domain-containing protein [Planctomycetota bacterium]